MEVEELRIGNLVLHNGKEERVAEIGTKNMNEGCCGYVRFKDKNIGSWLTHKGDDLIKPIPLTEEWLVKFGAKKENDKYVHDRFILFYFEPFNYWYVTNIQDAYMTKVEFVHEWQNFFRFSNGKELTIKN